MAKALELSDYHPRSYIEQVQLSKLTNDFQTLTDDMRKRFSVDGRSVLEEIYGSSPSLGNFLSPVKGLPPSRSVGGMGRGLGGRYSNRHGGSNAAAAAGTGDFGSPSGDLSLLSTSAPVRGSSPIAINQHRAKGGPGGPGPSSSGPGAAGPGGSSSLGATRGSPGAANSPSSSVAAAAGSTLGPSSILSSDGNNSIPGSVDSIPGAAAMAALAARSNAGSSGGQQQQRGATGAMPPGSSGGGGSTGGALASKGNGLLGQQLRNSSRVGSNNSLQGLDTTAAEQQQQHTRLSATGVDFGAVLAGDPASLALLRRLQDQMDVVAEGFKRHSGMQLHLDALTHQYKHLNESMAALSSATKSLTDCVQQLQDSKTQRPGQGLNGVSGRQGVLGGGVQLQGAVVLGGAAVVGGVLAAAAVLLAGKR